MLILLIAGLALLAIATHLRVAALAPHPTLALDLERAISDLALRQARDQADLRVLLEQKLRELAETHAAQMAAIRHGVNEQLHQAVEKQMQASVARVIEQFTAVQKAVGDVQAVAARIGDLKRVFANVKNPRRLGRGPASRRA